MHIDTHDGEFEITDVLLQAWMTRFPTVDLRREWPLMVLWLAKNPAKRPKNPIRFIENWLRRTQENDVKALAESGKRAQITAARVGAKYQVAPLPGESQETYNRRVIQAAASSILKRVA